MDTPVIVPADVAWMLVATALVLLMTPALAFFYGGLVRSKNALNTMMMSFVALGFVGRRLGAPRLLARLRAGHEPCSAASRKAFLAGSASRPQGTIPHLLFMAYQGTFAIITAALISGAIVERMRFGPYLVFITLWCLVVYAPVAHWVWGGGWLAKLGRARLRRRHRRARQRRRRRARRGAGRSARARTTAARRSCRTTCRSCCSARACSGSAGSASTPAARSRPTRSPALAFTNTMLAPGGDAASSGRSSTCVRTGKATAVGARHRRSSSASSRSRRRPASSARWRRSCSARSRRSRATSRSLCRARTAARRLARRGRRARRRRHGRRAADRRLRREGLERHRRRPALRQPRPARHPGRRRAGRDRLQRRRDASCCSSSSAS